MVVNCLDSLVLRGVTVVDCDGLAPELRLGTGVDATAISNFMCQPLSDIRPDYRNPAARPNHQAPSLVEEPAVGGAGRSRSAGVPGRQLRATSARRAASPLGLAVVGLFADVSAKRSEMGSSWHKPAGQMHPATRGTTSR